MTLNEEISDERISRAVSERNRGRDWFTLSEEVFGVKLYCVLKDGELVKRIEDEQDRQGVVVR